MLHIFTLAQIVSNLPTIQLESTLWVFQHESSIIVNTIQIDDIW